MRALKRNIMRIGVFDSGLGGLTVLGSIMKRLGGVDIIYLADTIHAPYGEKSHEAIRRYALGITDFLIRYEHIDALVIACNTATSAAVSTLRERFKTLPIVGTEPGIKPAIKRSKSGRIGILATPATIEGDKYRALAKRLRQEYDVEIREQACPGLVECIERGELESRECRRMLKSWLDPMREAGVDTIVLGCTHYPLAASAIRELMGRDVTLIETSEAIARRLESLLGTSDKDRKSTLKLYATGAIDQEAVAQILARPIDIEPIDPARIWGTF